MIHDKYFKPLERNMPQQVQVNKEDIAELIKELKDVYKTSVDLTPTSTGVDKVDTDIPDDVEKGFLIDPNGLFFKIEAITMDRVFLTYYANLRGPQGPQGEPGVDGQDGQDGQDGAAATISVGTTTTGAPGTNASVQNVGTPNAAVLNFTIPRGEKGDKGDQGEPGTGAGNSNVYFNNVLQNDVYFDSDPQQQLDDLGQDITDEATARQQADNTLQGNITAEAQARANADSTLQGNIDAEAQARAGADGGLQQQITANANAIAGKLDKVSTATTNSQAYIKVSDGSQAMADLVAGVATPNTIPYRDGNGRLQGANPSTTNDLITKGYGDAAYATKTLSNVTYPANTPGSTTAGSGDRVIETYISSISSGVFKWYRKWASGWIECGGEITGTSGEITQVFGVTFTQRPKLVISKTSVSNTRQTGTAYYDHLFGYALTTTSFKVYRTGDAGGANYHTFYYACGY